MLVNKSQSIYPTSKKQNKKNKSRSNESKKLEFGFFSEKWYSEGARAGEKAKNVNNNISNRSIRLNFINSRQSRLFTTAKVFLLRFGQIYVWLKIWQHTLIYYISYKILRCKCQSFLMYITTLKFLPKIYGNGSIPILTSFGLGVPKNE